MYIKKEEDRIDDNEIIIIADYSTSKDNKHEQWISDKWGLGKKGYLKIHFAVDIKTKEILALEVTDERVHDGKMMKKLVKHALNNTATTTKNKIHSSFLSDGAYDSNTNFKFLKDIIFGQ